jgi:hypothetical protein
LGDKFSKEVERHLPLDAQIKNEITGLEMERLKLEHTIEMEKQKSRNECINLEREAEKEKQDNWRERQHGKV